MSLTIHSRKSWGARAPRPRAPQSRTAVRELFIHWPALGSGSTLKWDAAREREELRSEQAFHMDTRGWSDIGYSFAVFPSGRVYRLRGMDWVPAAQEGHNTNTVAVTCVLGPNDKPTDAMIASLWSLKNHCDGKAGRDLVVRPHGDVTATSCPGPNLRAIIPELNKS